MMDPIQALLQAGAVKSMLFPPNSRYHGIDTATLQSEDGKKTVYLRRRFIPPPERYTLLQEHHVSQSDRLDNLTAHYIGDPENFWRLCVANAAMQPYELTETPGQTIRITLPEGITGASNA
jgi:hypothetical protein